MSKKVTQKTKLKVLYQNLGGVWYAFAENGEDVYFGRVPLNTSPKKALEILKNQQENEQSENSDSLKNQSDGKKAAAKSAA
jgi:hypothetical protein